MNMPPVSELVPHQKPILALDELTSWEVGHAEGRLTIRDDNPLLRDGCIDAVMALEFMAQATAACLGMEAYVDGGNVRVGMVIACRSMKVHRQQLRVGETFVVKADQVRGTDSISHYDGALLDEQGALVAECTMTLVHGEKPPE